MSNSPPSKEGQALFRANLNYYGTSNRKNCGMINFSKQCNKSSFLPTIFLCVIDKDYVAKCMCS